MKLLMACLLLSVLAQACEAQYYYKDLVATRENTIRWQAYRKNHVRSVTLSSFEADGKPTEGFVGEQQVSADGLTVTTHTRSAGTPESWIIAQYSAEGRLVKNTDTSDTYLSVSEYQYDDQGRIATIRNTSLETDNQLKDVELHVWTYDQPHPDKPASMLKIMNGSDTTYVKCAVDEKGNVTEERATRQGNALPAIDYYYDADNHLTDIARYNVRAQRLLPLNMFEYGDDGRVASELIVPEEGNSFYEKWYYVYDDKGLKVKDFCYNKQKELVGSVEYQYNFN